MSVRIEREQLEEREYANGLTVRESPIDGQGCFATVYFPIGRWIAQYAGERVTREEGARRLEQQHKKRISAVDSKWSIDGSIGGNGTEYINHSCNPNCIAIVIDGQIHLYAVRDILAGEEITVDYFDAVDYQFWECGCGSRECQSRKDFEMANNPAEPTPEVPRPPDFPIPKPDEPRPPDFPIPKPDEPSPIPTEPVPKPDEPIYPTPPYDPTQPEPPVPQPIIA